MIDHRGYPRPLLRRAEWTPLDGIWEFALDREARWTRPEQVDWNARIRVPFAPETPASGIGDTGFYRACWYRRTFDAPSLSPNDRLLLRFGAVDHSARVWVGDRCLGGHDGGYTPFALDITDALTGGGPQTIVVRAEDDPHDLAKPRGKQDWQLEPHAIWYQRTTGIWQTVWLERIPSTAIDRLRWTPWPHEWEIGLDAWLTGEHRDDLSLRVRLSVEDRRQRVLLADDTYAVVGQEVHRRVALSDPGIDDFRNELLWRPAAPTLIQAHLQLLDDHGRVIDEVESYTALRSVGVDGNRFTLNGRPFTLRMVLDQGYWPETGLTAPDDDALRRDIELTKAMGFNGVRKHQKVEDPRYLAWADRLGLLVWEEMPSAYRFTDRAVRRLTREWSEVIERDASHPCIVAWVPFNESWGVADLPHNAAQRAYVRAIYYLTKTLDPTRPVIGNDGWESIVTDILGIHDYEERLEDLASRYGSDEALPRLLGRARVNGRPLVLEGHDHDGLPVMLSEFGGIVFAPPDRYEETWGYVRSESAEAFAARYAELLETVRSLPTLAGFCYTQFADTYQEANGLLFADRTPKFPVEAIALATAGPKSERQIELERRRAIVESRGGRSLAGHGRVVGSVDATG